MPQGFNDAINAINDHFGDELALTSLAGTPVAWMNVESDYSKGAVPWMRLTIFEGTGQRISLGVEGCHRFTGTIVVQCFVRPGGGTKEIAEMADIVADIFRVKQISKDSSGLIRTRTPSTSIQGVIVNGWYQVNVTASYFRDLRASDTT